MSSDPEYDEEVNDEESTDDEGDNDDEEECVDGDGEDESGDDDDAPDDDAESDAGSKIDTPFDGGSPLSGFDVFMLCTLGIIGLGIYYLLKEDSPSREGKRVTAYQLQSLPKAAPPTCSECGTKNPHYCGRDGAQWNKGCRRCVVCASGDKWYCMYCKRGACCIAKAYPSAEHSDCKDCDYDYDD